MTSFETYTQLLTSFVGYKSISTDPAFADDIEATAEALQDWLISKGFEVELITGYENPLVFGRYIVSEDAPTTLVYGHYDVQPAQHDDGWEQDPFTLTEKDGRFVGRGAVDNKGQFLVHLATIASLIDEGRLTSNLEVLLEGNEETGSAGLMRFLDEHPEKITATLAVVSDGEIHDLVPKLEIGFRGTIQVTVTLSTSDRDLHSGLFGGIVPNAGLELAKLLATLYEGPTLAIANIADGAHQPNQQEIAWATASSPSEDKFRELTGSKTLWHEPGQTYGSQLMFRPTVEVIGMSAGYMGVGYRNSIPGSASAKLNLRVVAGQNPDATYAALAKHLQTNTPEYATLTLENDAHSGGTLVDGTDPKLERVASLLTATYGIEPLRAYCGASLPFVGAFQKIPNLTLAIIPLGNDDSYMHAVGENIAIENVKKALAFSEALFSSSL